MSRILRTSIEHITVPLADEGNYAYFQSSGAQNIKPTHINKHMEISIFFIKSITDFEIVSQIL